MIRRHTKMEGHKKHEHDQKRFKNGDQEIKKATTMMKKCLIILFILITLSICPTIESRRLKRRKSVVKPEVESVVKPSDGGKSPIADEEEVREVESVVKPPDVERREEEGRAEAREEDVEVREDEAEEEEGEEVLSEDEVDLESLPDADVNILVPLKEFRDLMGDEIEEARKLWLYRH